MRKSYPRVLSKRPLYSVKTWNLGSSSCSTNAAFTWQSQYQHPSERLSALSKFDKLVRIIRGSTYRSQSLFEIAIDGKLTSRQRTHHKQTSTKTAEGATETKLLGNAKESAGRALTWSTLGLVNFGEHGVGGLGNDGSCKTGNQTGTKVDGSLHARAGLLLVKHVLVGKFGDLLVNDEFGHGVGDLLEEDGTKARVEGTDALLAGDLGKARNKAGSEGGLGHQANAGGLERTKGNVSEELGGGRRHAVNGDAVVPGIVVADGVDGLLLEELVTAKLEGALQKVAGKGRAKAGQEGTGAFIPNDLADASDEAAVVGDGVELDARLDDINGRQGAVGDGAADGTGESEARVEVDARRLALLRRRRNDSGSSSHLVGLPM